MLPEFNLDFRFFSSLLVYRSYIFLIFSLLIFPTSGIPRYLWSSFSICCMSFPTWSVTGIPTCSFRLLCVIVTHSSKPNALQIHWWIFSQFLEEFLYQFDLFFRILDYLCIVYDWRCSCFLMWLSLSFPDFTPVTCSSCVTCHPVVYHSILLWNLFWLFSNSLLLNN